MWKKIVCGAAAAAVTSGGLIGLGGQALAGPANPYYSFTLADTAVVAHDGSATVNLTYTCDPGAVENNTAWIRLYQLPNRKLGSLGSFASTTLRDISCDGSKHTVSLKLEPNRPFHGSVLNGQVPPTLGTVNFNRGWGPEPDPGYSRWRGAHDGRVSLVAAP